MNDDTKVCPYCAENIKAAAVICRYCHRNLTDGNIVPPSLRVSDQQDSEPPDTLNQEISTPVSPTVQQDDPIHNGFFKKAGRVIQKNYLLLVLRDAFLLVLAQFIISAFVGIGFGAVGGVVSENNLQAMSVILWVNILILFVGYIIIGCLKKHERFKHLAIVAISVWLLNFIIGYATGQGGGSNLIFNVIFAYIAGLFSYIFVREPKLDEK